MQKTSGGAISMLRRPCCSTIKSKTSEPTRALRLHIVVQTRAAQAAPAGFSAFYEQEFPGQPASPGCSFARPPWQRTLPKRRSSLCHPSSNRWTTPARSSTEPLSTRRGRGSGTSAAARSSFFV